jgi:hypothetical protein
MFLAGVAAGAALMYFLDPERGRTRRARVGDQLTALTNDAQDALGKASRDLSNRAYGMYAETRKAVTGSAGSSGAEEQSNTDETSADTGMSRTAAQQ